MLGIEQKYYIGKKIPLNKVLSPYMSQKDKKKLRESIRYIELSEQIAGEEIPSVIDETYNCQVIMFFSIEVENLKESKGIGDILQKQIKPFTVFRFYTEEEEVYHVAEKRLHFLDKEEIVIDSTAVTPVLSRYYQDDLEEEVEQHIHMDQLTNKNDKVKLYRELLVKMYLLSFETTKEKRRIYWDSKIWYSTKQVITLYNHLRKVRQLQDKYNHTLKDKTATNKALKIELDAIEALLY